MFTTVVMNPMVAPEGRLCRPDHLTATGGCVGGGREGGLPPSRLRGSVVFDRVAYPDP